MSTLIWKEYRQNRRMFVAIGLFLLLPYLVYLILGITDSLRYDSDVNWSGGLVATSLVSLVFTSVAAAFAGGTIVAGERSDRSAEFLAYLPIRRGSTITAKLLVAFGMVFVAWSINLAIHLVASARDESARNVWFNSDAIAAVASTAILAFGGATMLSSMIKSPVISAISGLALVVALCGTFLILDAVRDDYFHPSKLLERYYATTANLIGFACLGVGVAYYLRRIEP